MTTVQPAPSRTAATASPPGAPGRPRPTAGPGPARAAGRTTAEPAAAEPAAAGPAAVGRTIAEPAVAGPAAVGRTIAEPAAAEPAAAGPAGNALVLRRPPRPATTAGTAGPAPRPGRDPFVDGVRALGTLLVVALHWLMVEATWDGRDLVVGNALAHGWAWLLTWAQPLPLLFFAAGAAARYDLARNPGEPGWRFAGTRLLRMARPVVVLVGVWATLLAVLPAAGVPGAAVDRVARIVPQPLWFLGVQLALLAVAPTLLGMLRRWGGVRVLLVAAALPVVVDLLRFSEALPVPGTPNVLLVWAVPFLGGLLYAQRRVAGGAPVAPAVATAVPGAAPASPPARTVLALLAGAGLAATVLLLAVGPYPVSLIGMPGDTMSNLAPPTAPVVGFAVAQVAAALLARDALAAWAGRSRLVRWVGARSMGLYLWHLTAMFAVAGVVLLAADRVLPAPWTWDWWTTRPVYLGAAAAVLVLLVAATGRVERWRAPRRTGGARPPVVPAASVTPASGDGVAVPPSWSHRGRPGTSEMSDLHALSAG